MSSRIKNKRDFLLTKDDRQSFVDAVDYFCDLVDNWNRGQEPGPDVEVIISDVTSYLATTLTPVFCDYARYVVYLGMRMTLIIRSYTHEE